MKISPNFSRSEFVVSSDHPALARAVHPSQAQWHAIEFGVHRCLQPWRDVHKVNTLLILSGIRSPALNQAVGGAISSDHLKACAVDVKAMNMTAEELFCSIIDQGLEYRQLILYQGRGMVHWSWNIPGRAIKRESIIRRLT